MCRQPRQPGHLSMPCHLDIKSHAHQPSIGILTITSLPLVHPSHACSRYDSHYAHYLRDASSQGCVLPVTSPYSTNHGMAHTLSMLTTTRMYQTPHPYNAHHTIRYHVHIYKLVPRDLPGKKGHGKRTKRRQGGEIKWNQEPSLPKSPTFQISEPSYHPLNILKAPCFYEHLLECSARCLQATLHTFYIL